MGGQKHCPERSHKSGTISTVFSFKKWTTRNLPYLNKRIKCWRTAELIYITLQ